MTGASSSGCSFWVLMMIVPTRVDMTATG
jgi:hypothetical protein